MQSPMESAIQSVSQWLSATVYEIVCGMLEFGVTNQPTSQSTDQTDWLSVWLAGWMTMCPIAATGSCLVYKSVIIISYAISALLSLRIPIKFRSWSQHQPSPHDLYVDWWTGANMPYLKQLAILRKWNLGKDGKAIFRRGTKEINMKYWHKIIKIYSVNFFILICI